MSVSLLFWFSWEDICGTVYFLGGTYNSSSLPGGEPWSSDPFTFGRKPASFHSDFHPTFRSFFIFLLIPHPRNHCNCPLACQLIFSASCLFARGKNADFLCCLANVKRKRLATLCIPFSSMNEHPVFFPQSGEDLTSSNLISLSSECLFLLFLYCFSFICSFFSSKNYDPKALRILCLYIFAYHVCV